MPENGSGQVDLASREPGGPGGEAEGRAGVVTRISEDPGNLFAPSEKSYVLYRCFLK